MGIGTLSERSLHAALKEWYARPGDRLEEKVDGYVVDIVRGEGLIEIQTGNFTAIKGKLAHLLKGHSVHVVHPVASERWVLRMAVDGCAIGRRKSPKRGVPQEIFNELVAIPQLLMSPNLTVEVLMTVEEAVYVADGRGSWRRKGMTLKDHRLLGVVGGVVLSKLSDFQGMLPEGLSESFTVKELARAGGFSQQLSQKMAFTLRHMGALEIAEKRGRAYVYRLAEADRFLYDPNTQDIEM